MRSALMIPVILLLSFLSPLVHAQEFTEAQQEVWSTLEQQVDLFVKQDWEKHKEFIHPKAVLWDADFPVAVTDAQSAEYMKKLMKDSDKTVAHYLVPVTVLVVDDVAIINFYARALVQADGESVEKTFRGHNTWKKENGRWLLLATSNGDVTPKEDDD